MKRLKLNLMFIVFTLFVLQNVQAQVSGLSYTIAPLAERVWWDAKSGLSDGYLGGAQLGLGFGQNVELRGSYIQSFGLTDDLTQYGFEVTPEMVAAYTVKDLDLKRYGGDIKLNLSRSDISPYITLGTGVQSLSMDTMSLGKSIYVNAGLGINFTVGDRYSLGIQGINNRFQANPTARIMTQEDRDEFGITDDLFETEMMSNYSLRASLVVYLGGRNPNTQTDIDQAYWDNFSGGFTGLSIPIEPTFSRMNFSENLPFKDTYMAGGSAGFNFGPLVGVRGFYMQALQEGDLTKFDNLAMYGGEGRFKLNEGRGLTPWLTIGGGVIDPADDYEVPNDEIAGNKTFAMGGLGIDIPFSKYLKATGFVRSMLTASEDLENLENPDQINYSYNYGVSLNFILGKKKQRVEVVKQSVLDDYILASEQSNAEATKLLQEEYEAKISNLEKEMEQAILDRDAQAVKEISGEKDKANRVLDELDRQEFEQQQSIQNGMNSIDNNQSGSIIRMTPSEFQLLLQEIQRGGGSAPAQMAPTTSMAAPTGINEINDAISKNNRDLEIKSISTNLEELKVALKDLSQSQNDMSADQEEVAAELAKVLNLYNTRLTSLESELSSYSIKMDAINQRNALLEQSIQDGNGGSINMEPVDLTVMREELARANSKIEQMRIELANQANTSNNNINGSRNTTRSNKSTVTTSEEYSPEGKFFSKFKYEGMSGFAGFGLGNNSTFNLGYRVHFGISDSQWEFVPETFFGFGSPSNFGIMGNLVYDMEKWTKSPYVNPYVGLGAGAMKAADEDLNDKLALTYNLLVGTYLNVFGGDLYVDFTTRNLLKYNQLAVGYRFPF